MRNPNIKAIKHLLVAWPDNLLTINTPKGITRILDITNSATLMCHPVEPKSSRGMISEPSAMSIARPQNTPAEKW